MNKKFILRLFLLIALGFSLHSCMHDDFTNKEPENHISTFEVFQKTEGKEPDYAKGFALLYNNYRKLHPEFSESVSRVQKEGKPTVYFYMSSQMFTLDDGSKVVLYSILQNDKVVGIEQ